MHGEGIFEWKDGRIYVGWYLNDEKHGNQGLYRFSSGKIMYGSWENGKFHGEGYSLTPISEEDLIVEKGIWE